jgi:hypothetical protein
MGAGVLAKAVDQLQMQWLTPLFRQQAGSHNVM